MESCQYFYIHVIYFHPREVHSEAASAHVFCVILASANMVIIRQVDIEVQYTMDWFLGHDRGRVHITNWSQIDCRPPPLSVCTAFVWGSIEGVGMRAAFEGLFLDGFSIGGKVMYFH